MDAQSLHRRSFPPQPPRPRSRAIEGLLGNALGHHQAGRLAEAERIYRQILAIDADDPDSRHLLGMIAYQVGRHEVAIEMILSAIAANPEDAVYHSNLGIVFQAQGKVDQAAACYERSVNLRPDCAEAWSNLGNARQAQGKLDEAVNCYDRALLLKPDCAEAWSNLGNVRQEQGKLDGAVACYDRALALKSDYVEAWSNLGNVRLLQGKLDESVVTCYERALALKPDCAEAWSNLGYACEAQGKLNEAVACYERALRLKPDFAEAHGNLGNARLAQGRLDEAMAGYDRALALKPDYAKARFSQSLAQLFQGDFDAGWRNYESRWQAEQHNTPMRAYSQPLWRGEKLAVGRLLIWSEQGVGDEIMFAGLIPDVIRTGNACVLDCDKRLRPLFARSFAGVEVVSGHKPGQGPELDIAAHLPGGSLPGLFRTTNAAFAATASPYLVSDPIERKRFSMRYTDGRRLAGIAWYTNNRKTGRNRSIDLSLFAPLFALRGIRWISLQYGNHRALEDQVSAAKAPILIDRTLDQMADIDRFAAQIAAMDMVVTIDNSTAHLAGALGVPTSILLPFAPDWRWLRAREDSPWYPSIRLFRQPKIGDWQSTIERVKSTL